MIQIDLQPELEARIAAQAYARGVALEQYIVEQLEATNAFTPSEQSAVDRAVENIRQRRKGNFLGGANIKDLITEGRKY